MAILHRSQLDSFITTDAGKRRFRKLCAEAGCAPGTLDGLDIYVVDERLDDREASGAASPAGAMATPTTTHHMARGPASMAATTTGSVLLSVLERVREDGDANRGKLSFLRGCFADFKRHAQGTAWIVDDASDEHDDDEALHAAVPATLRTPPPGSLSHGQLHITTTTSVTPPSPPAPRRGSSSAISSATSSVSPGAESSPGGTSSTRPARLARLKRLDTTGDGLRVATDLSQGPSNTAHHSNVASGEKGAPAAGARLRSPSPLKIDRGYERASTAAAEHGAVGGGGLSTQALCYQQARSPRAPTFDLAGQSAAGPLGAAPFDAAPGGMCESSTGGDAAQPFEVSTIIPNVLYLGPEPRRPSDVEVLEALGIRRILNMALEVPEDRSELALRTRFEKVAKLGMRDFVEEQNVQKRMDEACAFLGEWPSWWVAEGYGQEC